MGNIAGLALVYYTLWGAGIVVNAAVIALMLRRKLNRAFPIFFSYLVFALVQATALLVLKPYYRWYFYAYWTTTTLAVLAEFGVVYEIFTNVFRPYDALRKIATVLFRWSALVLVMVIVVTAPANGDSQLHRLMAVIFALTRSVRVMQVGLVLFLFLFSQQVGLTQRHRVFGVSLGFGIFAAVELMVATLVVRSGGRPNAQLGVLSAAAFVCCVSVWLYYMWIEEPERIRIEHAMEAGRLNLAVSGAINPTQAESFLPFIESAVERVLAERQNK